MTTLPSPSPAWPSRCTGRSLRLGGEGMLRTHGESKPAARVIRHALGSGVSYNDAVHVYASYIEYYDTALGDRRRDLFLA